MSNAILFINSFLSYVFVMVIIVALIIVAIFIGVKWRKSKDAKDATLATAGEQPETNS